MAESSRPTAAAGNVFEQFTSADVATLISEYPLAWVHAQSGEEMEASLLPLVGNFDREGRLVELIGHMSRANPLHSLTRASPRVSILVQGPQSYVSPEQAGRRDWGPTWNYAQLRIRADVTFDVERTEDAIYRLVGAMEDDREDPWRPAELGPRYAGMLRQIIGFTARVIELRGRFKLGQDERPDTLDAILANHPDPTLRRWMRRFNPAAVRP